MITFAGLMVLSMLASILYAISKRSSVDYDGTRTELFPKEHPLLTTALAIACIFYTIYSFFPIMSQGENKMLHTLY